MKKFRYILILSLALAFTLIACKKEFLERNPLDEETSANFYDTKEGVLAGLVAIYDVLGYQSTPGVSWAPFITVADILSDDSYAGGADANDGMDENQLNTFNIPTTNLLVHATWIKNYEGIYRANLLMEKIDNSNPTPEFRTRIVSECKFLRAYFHFELVRFFENIPLITKTLSPSEYDQPQAAPSAVYNQIAADLLDAIENLPEANPAGEEGRVTKWAAEALLARVYLFYNGVYGAELEANGETIDRARVLQYLEDLIANSGHDLFPDYETNFRIAGEFGVESVFEISYGDSPAWWDWGYVRGGEGNLSAQMQGPRVTGSDNWNRGWSFGTVGQKLVDDLAGDPRLYHTVLFEDSLDGILVKAYQHTGYYSKKYSSDAEHWGSDGQFELNRTCNHRVIRYSDVLLMAAELGSGNAQAYLDKVRARVGLPSIPATLENILKETFQNISST